MKENKKEKVKEKIAGKIIVSTLSILIALGICVYLIVKFYI
jgi:hypothetical protein